MFQALSSLACLASDPMDRSKARACTMETSFDDSSEICRLRFEYIILSELVYAVDLVSMRA